MKQNTNAIEQIQQEYGRIIARAAFELNAIRLQPADPFRWASGYRMPLYNDNRQFLRSPAMRKTIGEAFLALISALELKPAAIAGTATAGIPHATTLADLTELPLMYVRSSKKGHGLQNAVEGIEPGTKLSGEEVVLIEDLISTGGSSIGAVNTLREIGASVPYCLSIFSYGLKKAEAAFSELTPSCEYLSLLTYDILLEEADRAGCIDNAGAEALQEWRAAPFSWGEKRGFPKE